MADKQIKIGKIMIRATPIMETLTGLMIAGFIYVAGFLIAKGEIGINNFFSFLAAMMLVLSTSKVFSYFNMAIYQGTAAEKSFQNNRRKNRNSDQKNCQS